MAQVKKTENKSTRIADYIEDLADDLSRAEMNDHDAVLEKRIMEAREHAARDLDMVNRSSTVPAPEVQYIQSIIKANYSMQVLKLVKTAECVIAFKTLVHHLAQKLDQNKIQAIRDQFLSIFRDESEQRKGNDKISCLVEVRVMRKGLQMISTCYKRSRDPDEALPVVSTTQEIIDVETFIARMHPDHERVASMAITMLAGYAVLFQGTNPDEKFREMFC